MKIEVNVLGIIIGLGVIGLGVVGCAADPGIVVDQGPIALEASEVSRGRETSPEVRELLAILDEAPVGSTLRFEQEVTLEDGSTVIDPILVTVLEEELALEAPAMEMPVDPFATARTVADEPVFPIASCRVSTTTTTRTRTRSWESCLTFPDSEARGDAERAVRASVDTSCRSLLDVSDGGAFCAAVGDRFIQGPSTVSSDGICEVEAVAVTVAHARGTQTCLFGAYQTFVARATATSTRPGCGFACQ